jgi:hypothetical protein
MEHSTKQGLCDIRECYRMKVKPIHQFISVLFASKISVQFKVINIHRSGSWSAGCVNCGKTSPQKICNLWFNIIVLKQTSAIHSKMLSHGPTKVKSYFCGLDWLFPCFWIRSLVYTLLLLILAYRFEQLFPLNIQWFLICTDNCGGDIHKT